MTMASGNRKKAPSMKISNTALIAAFASVLGGASCAAPQRLSGHIMPSSATADSRPHETPEPAREVVQFWREAGPSLWFAKDEDFDRRFRDRFLARHDAAASGELAGWEKTPEGALALLILLDQFPRNAFRNTPRMYATDALARQVAATAVAAGHDQQVPPDLRLFFYLPFGHSESLADQQRSVELARGLGGVNLRQAIHHHDIILRFGRFPHRNAILGRQMTGEEQEYLDEGGYTG
jgi:uncharacterized protein (DUF924 family)